MHVDRLHGDKGGQMMRVLHNDLRNEPSVYLGVIGVDQCTRATVSFAPQCCASHSLRVFSSCYVSEWRTSAKYFYSRVVHAHLHSVWLFNNVVSIRQARDLQYRVTVC